MKCAPTPSRADLLKAYEKLQWSKIFSGDDVVLWAQWTRLDARLAEILIQTLVNSFRNLNPFALFESNSRSAQPQILAVLLEFALLLGRSRKIPSPEIQALRKWCRIITQSLKPASSQMFFVSDGVPRPKRDALEIERSLRPYRRWGFFANECLGLDKGAATSETLLSTRDRKRILDSLLRRKSPLPLTVNVYIAACGGRIHRRTAERDLRAHERLNTRGLTRGRVYVVK